MDFGSILGAVVGGNNSGTSAIGANMGVAGVITALTTGLQKKDENGNVDVSSLLKSLAAAAGPIVVAQALKMMKNQQGENNASGLFANVSESQIAGFAGIAGKILQGICSTGNKC